MDMEYTGTNGCHEELSSLISELEVMRLREGRYTTDDYLHRPALAQVEDAVDITCRGQMIDWMIKIIDHCKFRRETVAIATKLLDRCLMVTDWAVSDRSAFQLAAITSLYTAIKIHEPTVLSINSMVKLSRNVYTADQIEAMEQVLLQANQWLMNPSTSMDFSRHFAQLISRMDARYNATALEDLTKVQLETTLRDYEFGLLPASSVAFAAVMNSVDCMGLSSNAEYHQIEQALLKLSQIDALSLEGVRTRLYEGLLETNDSSCHETAKAVPTYQSSVKLHHSPRSVSHVKLV